jgi:lysophospholipase L1-like esterase
MKRITFLLIFIVSLCRLSAQEFHVEVPTYKWIDYPSNNIRIPGNDSTRLNTFFQRLDSLYFYKSGRLNILHIGGSHVQADMFSNKVRRNLDRINGDFRPPRGYIFPFNVAKTNNPNNYTVHYNGKWKSARNVQKNREIPLGVGGIAVYTNDPDAEITIQLNADEFDKRWDFDELKLIGYTDGIIPSVRPVLKYNDSIRIEAEHEPDSNIYLFSLPELTDSFTVCFLQEDLIPQTFVLEGFIPQKDEEGIVYHAIGVNGASVPSYLESENFEDELYLIAPDLVVFAIGINDASSRDFTEESFIANYSELIRKIQRVSPDCAFLFITNNDSFRKISRRKYTVNHNGLVAQKAFYRLAEQHQGGVWDLFSIMGGLNSMQQWEKAGLAKIDKVHFTQKGYSLIGDLFYNALINYSLYNNPTPQ